MPPALESLSPRCFLMSSHDDVANWINNQRVRTGDAFDHAEDYAGLRQRFGQLSHRWHPILTNGRLRAPHLAAIHRQAVRALEVSKLIYGELENERQGQSQLAPQSALSVLLDLNSLLLDRATAQLELVDSTVTYAEELHDAVVKLVTGETISPVWLVSLARRIQLEMRPRPELALWMPVPGLKLSDCLAPRIWKSEPEVYAAGLQTARLVGWLGAHHADWRDRLELLIVAALLQDIGFLRLERTTQKRPSELETRHQGTYRRHPSVGAGLAAGVGGYAIELSFLIAQHHERLDGTGYPHGLSRHKESKEVQLLASLVRFQELASRQPADAAGVEAACLEAGFQLFLESAQGAWSTAATVSLLEALDRELPNACDRAIATGQPFSAEAWLQQRWMLHAGEEELAPPHFMFSRYKAFSRSAQQTLASRLNRAVHRDPKG